jgi:S-adenosylmethionine decarboxylase
MQSLGKQLIVELYGCDRTLLDDPIHSERILLEGVNRSGATVIQPFFHRFSPHGVSGVVVIAESHVAIHTWPEYGYCALDIFTCGSQVKPELILDYIQSEFRAREVSVVEVKRGTLILRDHQLRHKPAESVQPV